MRAIYRRSALAGRGSCRCRGAGPRIAQFWRPHETSMKRTALFAGLLLAAVAALLAACKRQSSTVAAPSPDRVAFAGAGVSLEAGADWKRIVIGAGPLGCPPALVGEHGLVRAMLLDADLTDIQAAAARMQAAFERNPEAIQDSFRREEFATGSGLKGLHLSYTSRNSENGSVTEVRSHNYIVQNRAGRCVSISHIAATQADVDFVAQMVQKTLSLQ